MLNYNITTQAKISLEYAMIHHKTVLRYTNILSENVKLNQCNYFIM